jgi:glyoxylase-like metal-dependent hydrolase (beta-lactamase superfamily II)
MNRRRLAIALGVALVVVLGALAVPVGMLAAAFSGTDSVVDGTFLGGRVETVVDSYVGIFFHKTADGRVLLIDAGNTDDGALIFKTLERRGETAASIAAVLVTHGHPDHVSGIRALANVPVYAHRGDVAIIEGKEAAHGPLPKLFGAMAPGITVSHPVEDGQTFDFGGTQAQVFSMPGHTAGSVAWWVDGVLYLGDSATIGTNKALLYAPWLFSDDQALNQASIKALARKVESLGLRVEALACSHSVWQDGDGPLKAWR